jgi:CspA family cold shock protein
MTFAILTRIFKNKKQKEKMTGKVKFYNVTKGYGFITADNSTEDVFVHASGLLEEIKMTDNVEFETQTTKKGLNAINVKKIA